MGVGEESAPRPITLRGRQAPWRERELRLPAVRVRPVAVALAGIVIGSAALQYGFARQARAPWIMVDELVYSELAKSIAASDRLLIRDHAAWGYGVVYPALISPAWALFHSAPSAYAAAKIINAVAISSTAVPAYLLARRVARPGLALAAALLAVAVPSTLYAGTLMTENAFYPVFVWVALALVRCLEHPTTGRQLVVLGLLPLAFLTRAQAIVLVPAIALAPVTLLAIEGGRRRRLGEFRLLYGCLALGAAVAVIGARVLGGSPLAILGAYRAAGDQHYPVGATGLWFVHHLAELDLYVGVVPLVALAVLTACARRLDAAAQAFLAAALPVVVLLLLQVSLFATLPSVDRIEERNTFYLAPLLFTALVAWIARGAPRPGTATALAACGAAALPGVIPFSSLIGVSARSDTLGLLVWWWLKNHVLGAGSVAAAAVLLAGVLAALFVWVPARLAVVLPGVVCAWLVVMLAAAEFGTNGVRAASAGALFEGITAPEPDWVDRRVGARDGVVTALWTGRASVFTLWENEFFNRSIGPVLELGNPPGGGLPATRVAADRRSGVLRLRDGREALARFVLTDSSVPIAGEELMRDERRGMVLLRVDGVVRLRQLVEGLYDDGWSGRSITYTRFECGGGRLEVTVQSDPRLFRLPQRVVAETGARRLAAVSVAPTAKRTLLVPLVPDRSRRCTARFGIANLAVPAAVQAGNADARALGLRFLRFDYLPE